MTVFFDGSIRIRVLDLETTGTTADDAVVEIAAVDLVGRDVIVVGSDLVRPTVLIPPQASAVHHITDLDVGLCPGFQDLLPSYLDQDGERV